MDHSQLHEHTKYKWYAIENMQDLIIYVFLSVF